MYSREKRVLLREYMEQGWSKSSLAEKLGVSRRTIYHWVTTGQLDRDLDDEHADSLAVVVYRGRKERSRCAIRRLVEVEVHQYDLLGVESLPIGRCQAALPVRT